MITDTARLLKVLAESCFLGTCHPPSPLYVSRSAALAAGIPDHVPIQTINRLCSSGLMAIRSVAHSIQAGECEIGVAVGVESMSLQCVIFLLLVDNILHFQQSSPEPCRIYDYRREFKVS